MPPRAVASPKKKRSKCKASDASKAALPKRPCTANVTDTIPSTPLVSLGLTEADVMGAPRRSGRPNAGTGGRNAQLEKIGLVLESQSLSRKPKGTTSLDALNPVPPPPYNPDSSSLDASTLVPSFLSQQSGGRFGFAPSTTTRIPPSNAKSNPQVLNDPYIAMGMNIAEKRNQNALVDHAHSSQPLLGATYSDNLDPALRKEEGIVRQTLHASVAAALACGRL
ncbi:uncharacterized protein F5891DRAFT_984586 [Suillus fuscotomentosus]|uniref:Uncharacterized protein n=1 Tax=Suillus fuscotomentosus TaxID=1912939 RepID=A0AAD4HFW0_9AGAM|nr:uncharacterized protein F5891DRAFT_984586 [Suillus fuscotomentosus]KAG1895002.1 hypothetical protein F5891DRAFT_984586 [Suillus fuscotomentosus]